ncbi:PRC-barrel domain-containing protein [Micromonospora fluostatini]|uniref:PRC-barrel domain-containing protein n=1 Tax=Micromonospora sp. JCM 30529 TaxID=3421643 RepID=UPI003D17F7AD
MRAGELLGRTVYDLDGRRLGRVVDLVVRGRADGRLRLTDLIVARRWYGRVAGRLVGVEHHPSGPWVIRATARWISRSTHQFPVHRVRLVPPLPGLPPTPPAPPVADRPG